MFYEPDKRDRSVLPYDAFKAIVAPRPIGWITSVDAEGRINLEPYSFFNGVNSRPPLVMFASESRKDSVRNIEATGEFVCNLATWDLREAMNATSAPLPHGVNDGTHPRERRRNGAVARSRCPAGAQPRPARG